MFKTIPSICAVRLRFPTSSTRSILRPVVSPTINTLTAADQLHVPLIPRPNDVNDETSNLNLSLMIKDKTPQKPRSFDRQTKRRAMVTQDERADLFPLCLSFCLMFLFLYKEVVKREHECETCVRNQRHARFSRCHCYCYWTNVASRLISCGFI